MTTNNAYPVVPWSTLYAHVQKEWKQGEHIAIIGPTGVGKTTLIAELAELRKYVVVFVTKVHDDTIRKNFRGFERIEEWPPKAYQNKVLLWPKPGKTIRETLAKQHAIFKSAMDTIFQDKGWCCVFDEQLYICEDLRLEPENKMFQHQGRSSNLSCINATQRPSGVPLVTYSGSTHAFIWKNKIHNDMKRLSEIGGVDPKVLAAQLDTLSKYEFLYHHTRTGNTARSQVTF